MRILLVDDEVELTDPEPSAREGYGVDVAYDGATGPAGSTRQL